MSCELVCADCKRKLVPTERGFLRCTVCNRAHLSDGWPASTVRGQIHDHVLSPVYFVGDTTLALQEIISIAEGGIRIGELFSHPSHPNSSVRLDSIDSRIRGSVTPNRCEPPPNHFKS